MIQTKIGSIVLLAIGLLYITACTQPTAPSMLQNDEQKKDIISAILVNEAVSSELMDSLMIHHHDQMMTKMNSMMTGDKMMQGEMMGTMMDMCKSDDAMCKNMMDKTMEMCDADSTKCKMMMGSMQSHPNVMKSIQGMCNMKGKDLK